MDGANLLAGDPARVNSACGSFPSARSLSAASSSRPRSRRRREERGRSAGRPRTGDAGRRGRRGSASAIGLVRLPRLLAEGRPRPWPCAPRSRGSPCRSPSPRCGRRLAGRGDRREADGGEEHHPSLHAARITATARVLFCVRRAIAPKRCGNRGGARPAREARRRRNPDREPGRPLSAGRPGPRGGRRDLLRRHARHGEARGALRSPGAADLLSRAARSVAGRAISSTGSAAARPSRSFPTPGCRSSPTPATGSSTPPRRPATPSRSSPDHRRLPPRWRSRDCPRSPTSSSGSFRPGPGSGAAPSSASPAARRRSCGSSLRTGCPNRSRKRRGCWGRGALAWRESSRSCTRKPFAGRCRSSRPTSSPRAQPRRSDRRRRGRKPAASPETATADELDDDIREPSRGATRTRDLAREIGKRTGRPARDDLCARRRDPRGEDD